MFGEMEQNVRTMQYPMLAGAAMPPVETEAPADLIAQIRELRIRLGEQEAQTAARIETVRREAFEKGQEQSRNEQSAWKSECGVQLGKAVEEFRVRHDEYLARVEHEVVRLALAIAERVIRREAQMDPLLLAGAVRVALGQLAESTSVRLRVSADQREMWAEMLQLIPGLPLRPEVIGDAELGVTEAQLEAELGTVDLGVRAQLAEIERGFFDLLDARREPKSGAANEKPETGRKTQV